MASEELIQRGFTKKGITIVDYEYFPIHSTTLNQYKQCGFISKIDYGKYGVRKPDGLLIDRSNKSKPVVIAVLENKQPNEFQTDGQKKRAVEQCNDLCQVLQSKMGIITDGVVTVWINPNHPDKNNEYKDKTTDVKRSYSYILNEDMQQLHKKFVITEKEEIEINNLDDDTKETYQTIKKILSDTNNNNSTLMATMYTDPTPLAKSVWQDIYISTKSSPTACLYNVVEIFIFKFLSDLGVLSGNYGFDNLLQMYDNKEEDKTVLEHYANICRVEMERLFPKNSKDQTGIINGTIFVNKDGKPVDSQATLFHRTIKKYTSFGNLRNIDKGFKTKLFETFLKQSKDKSKLGQFFTPRKVVRAMVEMADIDKTKFICDPFCGVGGFILEPFQASNTLKNKFSPKNGVINPDVKLLGYDTGREDNDEQVRTIILAKANMLIYLSDLVEKNPGLTYEFAKLFNNTFHFLFDSNLGTLNKRFEYDQEKPDLILTNPPYITSGVAVMREQIKAEGLQDYYKNSGQGVEGLCLKWIISNLKRGGSAFVVLPDGIFNALANKVLRDELKKLCFIKCIISLPPKTFFNTSKKTYILGITKKDADASECENIKQKDPVFTYLVSNIGETLDVNRFAIPENDLDKAKNLFNQFKGSPETFQTDDPRCKIQLIEKFENEKYWIIDKWWSEEEKVKLGVLEEEISVTIQEFKEEIDKIKEHANDIDDIQEYIENKCQTRSVPLTDLFNPRKGSAKYTKKYINENKGEYPVYSSQTSNLGEIGRISTFEYNGEFFTWTTDGTYVGTAFYRNEKFSITTHCGVLILKEEYKGKLDHEYLNFILNQILPGYKLGEGSNKRLGIDRMKEVFIQIPVKEDGEFDIDKQKEIANKYKRVQEIKRVLAEDLEKILNQNVIIVENVE